MQDFVLAHAVDGSARDLATACADVIGRAPGHRLGFVYATSSLAPAFASVVAQLRERTGIEHWVGTVGHGICATGTDYFDQPAVVAMACAIEPTDYRLIASKSAEDAAKAARGAPFMAAIGVVHGDPRHEDVTSLIAALGQGSGAYLVGGLTSADRVFPQVAGSTTLDGGVSGVLLGGRNVQVAVGLTQGCSPIGPSHTITSLQGQVLVTLDDEPAFEVLRRDVGAGSDADPRRWLADIHAAIPVSGSDRADYVVRNIVGIGPEEGLVAIADNLDLGDRVMFVRRDAEAADRDLQRMLGELKARTRTPPKAGLYYSCLARGPNLFAEAAHEMRAIEQAFDDIPIVGFFGNGEIAHDRLYGYTGVLTLFS